MFSQNKRVILTVILCMAIMALITGIFVSEHWHRSKAKVIDTEQFNGTLLQTPRDIPPFNLTGIDNRIFNQNSLKNQWTMIFFGFTNCGYMCPTAMAELGKMYRFLEQKQAKIMPQVVMITIDPKRDSLEKLQNYVHAFNSHFYGARGSKHEVDVISKSLGIAYAKVALNQQQEGKAPVSDEQYDIQHTGAILLFNPEGRLVAFFTNPHNAKNLADDFVLLTNF